MRTLRIRSYRCALPSSLSILYPLNFRLQSIPPFLNSSIDTDIDEPDIADLWVVSFDDEYHFGSSGTDKGLRLVW